MKFFILLVILFTGFSIIVTENAFAEKCLPIELEYSIVGGRITELCKSDTNVQVNAKIQASEKGHLIIEIPQKVVYSLSGLNCELGELFVLMDGYETPLDNVTSDTNQNIITVSFPEGNHTIAFVGSTILPKPGPSDYCGIVMGYDSLYLPPKFQEKKEVSLKHIRCNDGLVVLAKYDSSPACVKYSTGVKLLERGWGMCSDELNYDRGNLCGPHSSGIVPFEPTTNSTFQINPCKEGYEFDPKFNDCNELPSGKGVSLNYTPAGYSKFGFSHDTITSFMEKYDTIVEGRVFTWYGHKTPSPFEYQYEIDTIQYHKFAKEPDLRISAVGQRDTFTADDGKIVLFGLDYHEDEDYYTIEARIVSDFSEN